MIAAPYGVVNKLKFNSDGKLKQQLTLKGMNAIEQLQSAKNTVNSVTKTLNSGFEFEAWERKEYEVVLAEAKNEVEYLTSLINENFDVFGVTV